MADEDQVSELDALIGEDEPEVAEAPEVVEETAEPEPAADEAESTGEAAGATPAPPPDPVPAHVPVAALQDERGKRQAAERELEKLRAEQADREAAAVPDPTSDPAGAYRHLQDTFEQRLTSMHIQQSRMLVMGQHEDFAEREQVFMGLAKDNPALVDDMLAAENPALFAYQAAEKHEQYEAMKDVDGYKAKLRAEVEAEVRKELTAEQGEKAEKSAKLAAAAGIPSLATATAASSGSTDPIGDEELSAIVKGHT